MKFTRKGVKNTQGIDPFLHQLNKSQQRYYLKRYGMTMDFLYESGEVNIKKLVGNVPNLLYEKLLQVCSNPVLAYKVVSYFLALDGRPTCIWTVSKYTNMGTCDASSIISRLIKVSILKKKRLGKKFFICQVKQ